jgi:hypothetical protein
VVCGAPTHRAFGACRVSMAEDVQAIRDALRSIPHQPGEMSHFERDGLAALERLVATVASLRARLQAAEHALREIHLISSRRRVGGPRMDGSESFSSPYFKEIRDLAEAALAAAAVPSGPEEVNEPGVNKAAGTEVIAEAEPNASRCPGSLTSPGGAPSGETATE